MRNYKKSADTSTEGILRIFSDVALIMLTTFIFLLVLILITSRMSEKYQAPKLKKQLDTVTEQLTLSEREAERLKEELGEVMAMATDAQIEQVLQSAGIGKKDFDLFIEGLKSIPGKDIHLVIDATGSMHGVTTFLIPVLRVIVVRSGKDLSALTWYSDGEADTYSGTMGAMFDQLMQGAPFVGNNETIGRAFTKAAENAPLPGAYVLIGDEPSDDKIYYSEIKRPVFTLPFGRSDPNTVEEYSALARKTGGKMLRLQFQ